MSKVTTMGWMALLVAVVICAAAPALADTYAYKVQYLQSSGVQHINTGVVPDRNTMYRGSYEYLGTAGSKANYDMIAACTSPRYSRGTRGL